MKKPASIVEIIGLAGAGKSTLARALCLRNKKTRLGGYLEPRHARYLPYVVKHTLLSLPMLLGQPANGRWFTLREVVKVAYLRGWHRVLQQQSTNKDGVIVIDQGPIYDLATLYEFGPERLRSPYYKTWWARSFDLWSRTLDLVIWLHAPEDILINRIHSRTKSHPVKNSSADQARDYLLRYQSSYEYIMSELTAIHDVRIRHFDTSIHSLEELVSQIYSVFCTEYPQTSPQNRYDNRRKNHE